MMSKSGASKEKKKISEGGLTNLTILLRPYIGKLILCMLCVVIVNAADLVKPLVAAVIIDDFLGAGVEQHGLYSVTGMGIAYFIVVMASAVFSVTQVRLTARMSQTILADMRDKVFSKILYMPLSLLDKFGAGRLITRATNDVEAINEFYSDVFLNLFKDVFLLLGILVVMIALDPVLALVAFTGVPLIVGLTLIIKKRIKRNFKEMKGIIGQINGFFAENVAGMRLVQTFNRQKNKLNEFRKLNSDYFRTTKTQVLFNSFLRPTMEVINSLVIALLICAGYKMIGGGTLAVGVLYAFTNYVKQFFTPINDLAEKYTTVQSASVSADRVYEILALEVENPDEGKHGGEVIGDVEFRDVWFAYDPGVWILKGMSFKVKKGQRVAFVGSTGAGKTTIMSIVAGYYPVQKGEVLIDGVPVQDWKKRDLRRGVATVLQDVFLFAGNVRDNIDMFSGLSDEAILQAIKTVQAQSFVSDLDMPITEQGLNLSTGQRQLLSFARAAAHAPSILVLDEATSAIDSHTEQLLQDGISALLSNRTSLIVAHRLSTIESCDQIMYIDKGVIAESGTHKELMSWDSKYRQLQLHSINSLV